MSDGRTCDALRAGLAVCLPELRSDHQKALRTQFDRTEPRSLWQWLKRSQGQGRRQIRSQWINGPQPNGSPGIRVRLWPPIGHAGGRRTVTLSGRPASGRLPDLPRSVRPAISNFVHRNEMHKRRLGFRAQFPVVGDFDHP
jgi:hypothetical protein